MKSLLTFTQELSTLVSAGLPIDRSLQILASLTENPKLKQVVQDILGRIQGGNSLAEAMGNHPRVFSKLYVNMVKAGESGASWRSSWPAYPSTCRAPKKSGIT